MKQICAYLERRCYVLSMGPFPVNPQERKMILVMQDTDIQRSQMEKDSTKYLTDDQVYVMSYPIKISADDSPTQVAIARIARPGILLSQNPFDSDHYFDVANESVEIALKKYLVFSSMCCILGARSVSVEQIIHRNRTAKTVWNAKASYGVGGVDTSGDNEKINELRQRISLNDDYTGGNPEIDQAYELLNKNNLTMEQQFCSLIDVRRIQSNPLKKRELEISLYNSMHSNLKLLANFQTKIPNLFKGSLNFSHDIKEIEEISARMRVEF